MVLAKRHLTAIPAALVLAITSFNQFAHAATPEEELCAGSGGTFTGGKCVQSGGGPGLFEDGGVVRNIINVLIFLVGVIAVIMLIIGAIRYATSAGDANATKGAKDTILYAIVGIVVAFAAFALVNFVINSLTN